jgi:hypothetical protein
MRFLTLKKKRNVLTATIKTIFLPLAVCKVVSVTVVLTQQTHIDTYPG